LGSADFYFGYLSEDYSPHYHDCFEYHYILKGNGTFQQGEEDIPLQPDMFLVSPPGTEHSFSIDQELVFYFIRYKPDGEVFPRLETLGSHYQLHGDMRSDFFRLRSLLGGDHNSRQSGEYLLLSLLFSLMARSRSGRFYQEPLIRAQNYMTDNLSRRITLQELADHVHLEKHYFCRLFKEGVHVSPLAYFERLKMDAACSMIEQGTRGYVIAENLGFCDETYFSRRFTRVVGMSPGAYRRKQNRS